MSSSRSPSGVETLIIRPKSPADGRGSSLMTRASLANGPEGQGYHSGAMNTVVVVPTRNRADLAAESIASVLAEDDPRLTVLVSDNSTDPDEAERLRSWCSERDEDRVLYVRPEEPLPMS